MNPNAPEVRLAEFNCEILAEQPFQHPLDPDERDHRVRQPDEKNGPEGGADEEGIGVGDD